MSFIETVRVYGIRCDYRGADGRCDASLEDIDYDRPTGQAAYIEQAVDEGWTIWQNGPRRQHRCPSHPMQSSGPRLVSGNLFGGWA